jgi:protein gp37
MGDLFHEKVEDATINNVLSTMAVVDWHWYLVLTKRAARMQATLQASHLARWLPHVGFGVSVECQSRGDERVPLLLDTPAALRFISCEPLLGPVDLRPWLEQIDWVIAGGETGPMARKTKEEWVRSLRDQCNLAGKPFFFKQWATRPREPKQHLIDGQEWRQLPAALLVSPACASATG